MTSRIAIAAAGTAALAVVLASCSSGSSGDPDALGTGAVTDAADVTTATSSPAPSTASPTVPSATRSGSFAERAGIPTARYVDAGAEAEVPDQSGDGRVVRIDEARLTRGPGHIAIFTRNGSLLGSAPISRGTSPATVRLTTPVPASGELEAVLFTDDGDGRFDLTKDRAVNDGDTDADDRLDLEGEDFDYALR